MPSNNVSFAANPGLSDRDYVEFHRQNQVFEHVATYGANQVTLTGAGDATRISSASVTPDFFKILRVNPSVGRSLLSQEDQAGRNHVVLLGNNIWRGRFGADAAIVGKTITLDGIGYTVIGVMPAGFNFPDRSEIWMPLAVQVSPQNSFIRPVIGRLKPGFSQQQAQAALETFARRMPRSDPENRGNLVARVIPLKDSMVGKLRSSLLIFLGAVAFVLLIACANFANLLLIRATARRQEISVRAALGAGRWRLVRQLLTESTLVSLGGGAAGMLLATLGVPALLALAPTGKIPRAEEIHIDAWVLMFTLGVSLLTGILFGLAPAFGATRLGLRESLGASGRTLTGRHAKFRNALVVLEIALALVLLVGAGLMLKSFSRMRAMDPGFRARNVLTMTVDLPESTYRTVGQMKGFHQRTLEKLDRLPGVLASGAVNWLPLGNYLITGDFQVGGGRPLPAAYIVDKPAVTPSYFDAMGIHLAHGRDFSKHDTATAPGVVIVSQSVAKQAWPGEDPIGKRISMENHPKSDDWLTVVGVVDDIRQEALTHNAHPAIYQTYLQVRHPFFLGHMTFIVRTASDPLKVAPAMRRVLRDVDKNQATQAISTMEDVVAETTTEPRFQTRLLGTFAVLALMLAGIGIYGVLSYAVFERTHEIGIRVALGAGVGNVIAMVLRKSLLLAAAGVTLGIAGSLALTRVLAKFLFDVRPTDPTILVLVALLMGIIALVAGCLPARRASKVDPGIALRFE